jgi:hypothetical protein
MYILIVFLFGYPVGYPIGYPKHIKINSIEGDKRKQKYIIMAIK